MPNCLYQEQNKIYTDIDDHELLVRAKKIAEEASLEGSGLRNYKARVVQFEDDLPTEIGNARFEKFLKNQEVIREEQNKTDGKGPFCKVAEQVNQMAQAENSTTVIGDQTSAMVGERLSAQQGSELHEQNKVQKEMIPVNVKVEQLEKKAQNRDNSEVSDELLMLGTREDLLEDVRLCQAANYSPIELQSLVPQGIQIPIEIGNKLEEGGSSFGGQLSVPSSDMGPNEPEDYYTHYSDP